MTVEHQEDSPPKRWAAWANSVWPRSSHLDHETNQHWAQKKIKKRVSFSEDCTKYFVPKRSENRSNELFISHSDIFRNTLISDSECAQFGEDWNSYNDWLLDEKATKIAGGVYCGRLGFVEKICVSKVYIKLVGDDTNSMVCINRASIAEGHFGTLDIKIHQNSFTRLADVSEADEAPSSKTAEARIRRSERLAKKAAQ